MSYREIHKKRYEKIHRKMIQNKATPEEEEWYLDYTHPIRTHMSNAKTHWDDKR